MDIDEFWNIIALGKDSDTPEVSLKFELQKLCPEEIASFQSHFDVLFDQAYRWNLWGAAYIIHGGCSDDGFIDFRYALISKGKALYEKALENPDSLSELNNAEVLLDNELFGYVASQVYENIVGKEIPSNNSTPVDESMGEEWDFDDEAENKKRLPRLYSVYC
jgi:hypothetical protein